MTPGNAMDSSPSVPEKRTRPTHVAIIMDGNGRWAVEQGLPRLEGHRKGADVVREITTFARELGIQYLTLYSFSRQNWRRPPEEVAGLMQLLESYCRDERETLMKNDIRLMTIGRTSRLPDASRVALEALVEHTADNRSMTLTLAVDYGGREEIVGAVRRLAQDVKRKRITPEQIDESLIEAQLDTALLPDPDLVIRTSGEMRVSNFLLWQIAYSELHFTDVRWPEFGRQHFVDALWAFARRERRFGATTEQLVASAGVDARDDFEMGELPPSTPDNKDLGPC